MGGKKIIFLTILIFVPLWYFPQETKVKRVLAKSEDFYTKIKIFTSILETIQRSYIDQREPDELLEDAIKGVISNLDPHTVYLPADDYTNWNQNFEGYTGIGISFEIIRGKITVMSVMNSSPAEEIGLQPGDKILKINGAPAIGLKREEASKRLNGPIGLPINIVVASERWQTAREFQLFRERILLQSVPYALMLRPQIGYIKIERFTSTTSKELDHALRKLESKGMNYLILDLRGNSGGYLNAAVEVADKFIPGGHKIVSTKGRLSSSFQEFYSTHEKTYNLYPLVVLIDHGSASASEIVAGAIQDLDRGLIVGKTSFGKGLVQSQYRFHDGSALLMTTAKYYTPSGRPIQRDFFDKSKDEYYSEAYNDSLLNSNSIQKEKPAYRTLLGRAVYAGGGIKPDLWIENEENTLSEPLRKLFFSEKRYFYTFAEDFLMRHPKIKTDKKYFINKFEINDKIYRKFIDFVRYYDPPISNDLLKLEQDKKDIKFLIKREMAYMIWGGNVRFTINLTRDHQLNEAIRHFSEATELLSMAYSLN